MSKRKKRLEKLRQSPNNVSLEDLRRVLEDHGFIFRGAEGSHYTFTVFVGGRMKLFTVPFRRPVKPVYVKRALQWIDEVANERGDDADDSE